MQSSNPLLKSITILIKKQGKRVDVESDSIFMSRSCKLKMRTIRKSKTFMDVILVSTLVFRIFLSCLVSREDVNHGFAVHNKEFKITRNPCGYVTLSIRTTVT